MVSYEEIKKYKAQKINELKHSEKYNDFLNYVEKELFRQINEDPFRLVAYIKVPEELNNEVISDRLTDDYGYQVIIEEKSKNIIIKLSV